MNDQFFISAVLKLGEIIFEVVAVYIAATLAVRSGQEQLFDEGFEAGRDFAEKVRGDR